MEVNSTIGIPELTPELQMLLNNLNDGYNYQERRRNQWRENYELYRDNVIVNRLTQRQSVNLPLMKMVVRTGLKDIDDMPVLYFENLDNDKQAELFKNEYWKWTVNHNKMDLQDIVDKRQVMLFGRTFDQWQIIDGAIKMTIQDPHDILVQRFCDPYDLNSSRFLIHMHIFEPLSSLEQNEDYDQEEIRKLKQWYASEKGIVKAEQNQKSLVEKNKIMSDMGVPDIDSPVLGETYVELTLHFLFRDDEKDYEPQLFLYVIAENNRRLMKKPLEEVIGKTVDNYWRNHLPYVSWGDDLEKQDFWSDGVADIVRVPNQVLNSWFSQLVENRTMRNFGMHYFNSNIEGFNPQTLVPVPWGWYGIPVPANGSLDQIMKKVDIPDLSESIDEMQFVITMMEKATGATSGQQGVANEKKITLGEFQATLTEAKERIKGMSKFYTPAWKQRGEIFIKLIEAGADKLDAVRIEKKGRNTNDIYTKEISPSDWMTKSGYRCKVWSQDEKDNQDVNTLQKQNAVKTAMPDNPKVTEIYQRKLLEWAGYDPDEINDIMEYEEQKLEQLLNGIQSGMGAMGGIQPTAQPNQNVIQQGRASGLIAQAGV